MSTTTRNVLIVLAIAAAVYAIPGGDDSADFIAALLSILITASFAFFGWRIYRERRMDLFGLTDRSRGMLYGALGVIVLMFAVRAQLFSTPGGALLWFAALVAAVYALVLVYREFRANAY